MKLTLGTKLTQSQVQQVKRAFVHRPTTENGYPQRNRYGLSIPAISDAQWIAEHAFYIKDDGNLADKPRFAEPFYLADKDN